jgi:hypothetical protein
MTGPQRREGLPTVRVSDGEIITTPDGTAHYLNAMAALIYELCDGRSAASIASSAATVFDLAGEEAGRLVATALDEMREKGLIA